MSEQQEQQGFKPKPDAGLAHEVAQRINRLWDKITYEGDFEKFLDITLAVLERREADYQAAIKGLNPRVLDTYNTIFVELYTYFMDGNYGDPLGLFYMERFSHGRNGEFYTPWNVAFMMAQMLQPEPDQIVCDPTCGSGIMLLAAKCVIHEKHGWLVSSRYGRNMYGMDISSKAIKMSKINNYLTDYLHMIDIIQQALLEMKRAQVQAPVPAIPAKAEGVEA